MSPFDKIGTWVIAALIWFVVFFSMLDNSDFMNTNFLLIYAVVILCTGGYLLIVWIVYKLEKKHEDKINRRVESIKNKYNNAYEAYKADNTISYEFFKERVAAIPDEKWEEMETEAKALNDKYDTIRHKYKIGFEIWSKKNKITDKYWASDVKTKTKKLAVDSEKEIIKLEQDELNSKWSSSQNEFSSHCRDLRDEIIPSFGCYVYNYKLPIGLFNNSAKVWQMFAYSYCLDKTIDYSLEKACYENAEIVTQHKWVDIHTVIEKTCDYINKLYDEEGISLYFNFPDGWKEDILKDIMECFNQHLNKYITKNKTYIESSLKRFKQGISNTSLEDWVNKIYRRVVIIDLATENEQLIHLCESVTFKAKDKYPLITVVSLYKCFSSDEMKEIIEKDRQETEAKKKEEEEKQRQYRMLPLDEIPNLDDQPYVPNVSTAEYEKGVIITDNEIIRVNYDIPQCSDNKFYSFYTAPTIYNVVFPYRRRKVVLRGYTEAKFENRIRQEFKSEDNYEVLGDVSIVAAEGYQPYEPDIAIVEKKNKYGLRIDIEIDEPYSGYDKEPIHYIGCGDEFRDKNLANIGWLVIRFSEDQIFKEPYACICYIKQVVSQIDNTFLPLVNGEIPNRIRRWTEFEAKRMMLFKKREKMLKHEFGKQTIASNTTNTLMSEFEKKVAVQVNPLYIPSLVKHNIDNSLDSFEQDSDLQFEPHEHIYIYKGHYTLDAVSTVVNKFFKPFESFRISFEMSMKKRIDQHELLEEWDYQGQYAREIGTFMHSQIEAYFSHEEIKNTTHFVYNGVVKKVDEDVSIEEEMAQFKEFLSDNPIKPFRTEWHIFDSEYKIAGTIDLLCRNGKNFDIYDWKRSYRASPYEMDYSKGINGLEHIPDISFYHYALQQNLYKYILEKSYNIKISRMYIVVLHPYLHQYEQYEIPRLDEEIKTILKFIGSQKGIIDDKDLDDDEAVNIQEKPSTQLVDNHECVDLGLSVKWATCNIGATCPEDLGDYFAWGETMPKRSYYWINYRLKTVGDDRKNIQLSKYNEMEHKGCIDNKRFLEPEDDVASIKYGSKWRMPTRNEFRELINNCTWKWTEVKGIKGYIITSKVIGYSKNHIFLPAAGYKNGKELKDESRYWTNEACEFGSTEAYNLEFKSDYFKVTLGTSRFVGHSIRPVCL